MLSTVSTHPFAQGEATIIIQNIGMYMYYIDQIEREDEAVVDIIYMKLYIYF